MVAKAFFYFTFLALLSSCTYNMGTVDSNAIYRGFSLVATRPNSIDEAWKSSLRALDLLKISIKKRSHSYDSATIIGVTREDNSAKITLKAIDNNTTRISIRVGVFGDQILSQEILRLIDNNMELLRYENREY